MISITLRLVILAGVGILIIKRLSDFGWSAIASEMPTSIAYFALFPVWYLAGPAIDAVLYRHLWGASWFALFPVMLRKRVLNESVLGYSGEAYLAFFAGRRFPNVDGSLFNIRDANIISSFVSTSVTLAMIAVVFSPLVNSGKIPGGAAHPLFAIAAAGGLLALLVAGAIAGPKFLRLTKASLRIALGVYVIRNAVVILLQIALWKAALPATPFFALFIIMTTSQAATRIPFMPSYDVLLLGAGIAAAPALGLPVSEISGVFVACFALSQILNFSTWVLTVRGDHRLRPPLATQT